MTDAAEIAALEHLRAEVEIAKAQVRAVEARVAAIELHDGQQDRVLMELRLDVQHLRRTLETQLKAIESKQDQLLELLQPKAVL
jgi:isochorismate synthase EntC